MKLDCCQRSKANHSSSPAPVPALMLCNSKRGLRQSMCLIWKPHNKMLGTLTHCCKKKSKKNPCFTNKAFPYKLLRKIPLMFDQNRGTDPWCGEWCWRGRALVICDFPFLKGERGQAGGRGWPGEDGLKGAKVSCQWKNTASTQSGFLVRDFALRYCVLPKILTAVPALAWNSL